VNTFDDIYRSLNDEQRAAVDHIDGPLLVLAGPGTGKTHLLSARIANILRKTDTPARAILAMTFTENGARNMRERLVQFIGADGNDVHISTYHGFGDQLISNYPEYFGDIHDQQPVDELRQLEIVEGIIDGLSYDDPLKSARYYVKDVVSTISELKRALLGADTVEAIAQQNLESLAVVNQALPKLDKMPHKSEQEAVFAEILSVLNRLAPEPIEPRFGSVVGQTATELQRALDAMASHEKGTSPLTAWKNEWMIKNRDNVLVLGGARASEKLASMANIMRQYEQQLAENRWYDFADMIVRSIEALERHDELRFTLQEKYLYLVLDEFQDTNAAQLRLVELLTNNPVAEGRPNVMAVGDDDQAIFAFQGAQYSNMLSYFNLYRDTELINLTQNYRSHHDILHTAHNVAEQIEQRLHHQISGITKRLDAASDELPAEATIARHEFMSPVAEAAWTAGTIKQLIEQQQVDPSQIAIIAPKHAILESYLPHLNHAQIPVHYDKREDIFDAPLIRQLLPQLELVQALADQNHSQANSLWPAVLAADWWHIVPQTTWDSSWAVYSSKGKTDWTRELLSREPTKLLAGFMVEVARQSRSQPLERTLDQLHGVVAVTVDGAECYSPLREQLFNPEALNHQPQETYQYLTQLSVLRDKLREHRQAQRGVLSVADAIEFVEAYRRAELPLKNSSPYHQAQQAVQLQTVYGSKGLEYDYVFIAHAIDEVWGTSKRGGSSSVSLPQNLAPIRHSGASEDEKLRDLFVAITRARHGLFLTSHSSRYSGKQSKPLVYLQERVVAEQTISEVLPDSKQIVRRDGNDTAPAVAELLRSWQDYYTSAVEDTTLRDLLQPRLDHYKISPTHLNTFIDLEYGDPEQFVLQTLLRFPSAPSVDGEFGNAVHESLQWLQNRAKAGSLPAAAELLAKFDQRLAEKVLSETERKLLAPRGHTALKATYEQWGDRLFGPDSVAELSFWSQGVTSGDARLTGNIDLLLIDKHAKTITVVDYKTGSSYRKWKSSLKLLKYQQQLYFYKLLVEGSREWGDYTVGQGRLLFVEPDETGEVVSLELNYKPDTLVELQQLIAAVWQRIMSLDMPDVSDFRADISGSRQFMKELREQAD